MRITTIGNNHPESVALLRVSFGFVRIHDTEGRRVLFNNQTPVQMMMLMASQEKKYGLQS